MYLVVYERNVLFVGTMTEVVECETFDDVQELVRSGIQNPQIYRAEKLEFEVRIKEPASGGEST